MTLWHGRFADGPADELLAFTESLSFDRRLAPDDLAGSRAHVAMLARVGLLDRRGGVARHRRARPGRRELADGTFVFAPDRRRHPHRDRAPRHRARGRRRARSCTPAAAATTRSRPRCASSCKREGADAARRVHGLQEVLLDAGDAAGADEYLPGYTHLQRRPAGAPRAPPARALLGVRARRRPLARRARARRRVAARRRARSPGRACRSTPTASPPTSASRAASRTRSTRSPTATSWPRRSSCSRSPRCTSRASARRSCCGRARSSASCGSPTRTAPGRRCCRRRRTPTSPSSPAARPAGSSATSPACSPR